MAFVNLPPNLKDMFYALSDRISKLETGPNQAWYIASSAQGSSSQALVEAAQALAEAEAALAEAEAAYALSSQALIKDANTITNAQNQLTAINSNGITVYSGSGPSSGPRVVLNSLGLTGSDGTQSTFAISASTGAVSTRGAIFTQSTISGGSLNINGNTIITPDGQLTAVQGVFTGSITAYSGAFTGSITAAQGTIGGWSISNRALYTGTSRMDSLNGNATFSGDVIAFYLTASTGLISGTSGGDTVISGGPSYTNALLAYADAEFWGGSFRSAGISSATTSNAANVNVRTDNGVLARSTASSQRYKNNITNLVDIPDLDPKKLYELPVRAFKFNVGYLSADDDRNDTFVPGFIAEEVDAIYPIAAEYDDGQVESWNDRMMLPAMLALIQEQNQRITELENKLNN